VDGILLSLWLRKLLLLWLSRLLLLGLNSLLRLNSLLQLAQDIVGCQLPDSKMTSNALVSGMTDVNHPQFRDRRV
jgi:hypothetical protein